MTNLLTTLNSLWIITRLNWKIVVQVIALCIQIGCLGWMIYIWNDNKNMQKELVMVQCWQEKPCINPNQMGLVIRYLENLINLFNKFI